MATFTITLPDTNIDTLVGKAGGDTYNINGGTLVIDQDSRFGQNTSATSTYGTIAVSTTLGGVVDIDARAVRWIPYNNGSGNVPAGGTVITQPGWPGTGKLVCVASAIDVAPTAPAAAMPASGWIKVKQVSGAFEPGEPLGGIGATPTGPDVVAPISIVGDETAVFSVPRLGSCIMRGAWYAVGFTDGLSATTYQLPTQGEVSYIAGVQVETAIGSGVYEWYPNAGTATTAGSMGTDSVRGKVCWISTAGVLRLGFDGTNIQGHLPSAGRAIRIPNILTSICTTAARSVNAVPNVTLANRFRWDTTAGGAVSIEVANLVWRPNFVQAYSVVMTDVAVQDQISVQEIATYCTWNRLCVGATAAQSNTALQMTYMPAGGTISDSVFLRYSISAAQNAIYPMYCSGWTFNNVIAQPATWRAGTTPYPIEVWYCADMTFDNCLNVGGVFRIAASANVNIINHRHADRSGGTTDSTRSIYALQINGQCRDVVLNGYSYGGLTNVHSYLANIVIEGGATNVKVRNIGTRANPLNLGSANASDTLIYLGDGAVNVKIQRVWHTNARTNNASISNAATECIFENSGGDQADTAAWAGRNMTVRGIKGTALTLGSLAVYGTHWFDGFSSDTAGAVTVLMNEPTDSTLAQVTLTGGGKFTGAGGLIMPTIGMTATFEMPYFMLGHTGFQNAAATMTGGTIGNYSLEFQVNTGSGFGAWTALTGANLAAVGAFPSTGVKLKVRITTTATNAQAITSLSILTTSTASAQDTQLYPLDTNTITFTGLPVGSDVVVLEAGTETVLAQFDSLVGTSCVFEYEIAQNVDVGFIKPGYMPFYLRNLPLTNVNSSIPVNLTIDRNYT